MDPNEALAKLRAAMEQQQAAWTALDDWLSRDGFLPEDWKAEEDRS